MPDPTRHGLGHKAVTRKPLESPRPALDPAVPRPARPEERLDPRAAVPTAPFVLSIVGASSNAGKTHLAVAVVRLLKARGETVSALKVTRTHVGRCPRDNESCGTCDSLVSPFEVIEDRERLDVPHKDTGRTLRAGADQVLWLLVQPDHVADGLLQALRRVRSGAVLVAEGNSFRDYCGADRTLMVVSAREGLKPSAGTILDLVDAFVVRRADAPAVAQALEKLGRRDPVLLDADLVHTWFDAFFPRAAAGR